MALLNHYDRWTRHLEAAGEFTWPLFLRAILFWEFWESGITKLRGQNWFADIPWAGWQKGFPWPFDAIPMDLNWFLATWGELVLAVMLLLGLFTRFAAVSLIVITVVATAAVHWPAEYGSLGELWQGYRITADGGGNFKLPLLFVVMLLPLVFHGGGAVSLDRLLVGVRGGPGAGNERLRKSLATGLALAVLGVTVVFVEPAWGFALLAGAAVALVLYAVRD